MVTNEIGQHYIDAFREAFEVGVTSIVKASEIYVKAIDALPEMKEQFTNAFADTIPASAWASFERVGRKQLHPNMLYGGGKNAMFIRRLTYSDQSDVFGGKMFPLLQEDGGHLLVDLRDLPKNLARQLVGDDHIRSCPEQKAFLISEPPEQDLHPVQIPYTIKQGKITFRQDTSLTKREMTRILSEM